MENQVSWQLLVFAQSVLLGLSIGVLYDLLRPFRRRFPRLTAALDSVYCLAVGLAAVLFVLRRSQGEVRGYYLLGAIGGAVLYFCGFSGFLRPVWDFWAESLVALVRLAAIPLRLCRELCKKIILRGKNLFYFARKCYTIRNTGSKGTFSKGGRRHGKENTRKKEARRLPGALAAYARFLLTLSTSSVRRRRNCPAVGLGICPPGAGGK